MRNSIHALMIGSLLAVTAGSTYAQWTSQTIPLRAGWNAVFIEVQPEPRDCATLFAGLRVESAWRFNRQIGKIQFISDPNKLVPNEPDWLTYLPPGDPLAEASRLNIIEGNRPYLIKRANDAPATNWTVKGTTVLRSLEWLPDSLNLVGFPLKPGTAVTFQSFLSHAAALATNYVYRLSAGGVWVRVNTPSTTLMTPGEAFWVQSTGPCDYSGTLKVDLDRKSGLSFGRELTEETLRISNSSTRPANIVLRVLDSEAPPPGTNFPALAGSVPLAYKAAEGAQQLIGWTNLPSQLVSSNVPPGGEWKVRLAVRRPAMTPYVKPPGVPEAKYQTIIEVNDGVTRLQVPVTAEGADRTGLWVGYAVLNQVSAPDNPTHLEAAAGALQFRLIIHVDDSGQPRLLQKILQRWQPGKLIPAEDGSTNLVVGQPGRFVLLTDEAKAAQFQGAGLRDGQEVGRRFSTAAFGFRQPIPLTPTNGFGADGSVFTVPVVLDYNDPLNPFVHRYHPDHNNLDENGDALRVWNDGRGQQTRESFTVKRQIELRFSSQDPGGLDLSAWGDKRLGGEYRETFIGLHRYDLFAKGTFTLFRVSSVGVLDPEP